MGQDATAASGGIDTGLTRREVIGGAAAVGAASLIAPAAGMASTTKAPASVSSIWVGGLTGESTSIRARREFSLAGIEWTASRGARIELRTESVGGRWSPWAIASVLGHDGDGQRPGAQQFGEPIWTGPATRVQLRSDRPVAGVRVHLVAAGAGAPDDAQLASAPPLAAPVLETGPGQPPIIARSGWAQGRARPVHRPEYGTIKLAFVHHTVTPNGYGRGEVPAILRSIFDYHVYVRGFWDIAYNFLIDAYGRIWEGRAGGIDMAVMGAQAGGYNLESTGVAVIGNFMDVVPSGAAIRALRRLIAWKLSLHGLPTYGRVTVVVNPADAYYTPFRPGAHVSLPRVAGHRDGDTTDCPGDAFYHRLPQIRPHIVALAGTPAVLTLALPAASVAAGSAVTLSGQLALLTGAPLAGEPITLQQLGPKGPPASTIGTATTAADGSWSAALTAETSIAVRALHQPYPAAVADWASLAVAPVLTLQLESSSPLIVTGTITAAKRWVTVALYPSSRTTGKPLAKRRVPVSQYAFTAQLPEPPPGDYLVVARSAADPSHAPAASAPLSVTVS